jgi:hypothetical protein
MAELCNHCKTDHDKGQSCVIPEAAAYVVSTDSFMSNWGRAEGRTNVCVVPCESAKQAEEVAQYVRSRSEQKRVRIVTTKPRSSSRRLLSLIPAWVDRAREHNFIGEGN